MACRSDSEPLPKTGKAPDACGASAMQGFVGQERDVLETAALPDGTRVFKFGAALTMDFKPDRLNVELDESGTILRIFCG